MAGIRNSRNTPAKIVIALLLTMAAGLVDVVGFLLFWRIFTAHMTGNTAHFAMSVFQHHWGEAAKAGCVIPSFLAGSVGGRAVIEYCARAKWRRAASLVFLVEAAVFTEVIWLNLGRPSNGMLWTSLLLLSFAMGLQTAALTRVGPLTVHTTFVTGMLNSLAQRLSNLLFWSVDALTGKAGASRYSFWRSRVVRESGLLLGVWLIYVVGGVLGALLGSRWRAASLLVPLGLLFVAIIVDQVAPLTIEEEEEEATQEIPLREEPKGSPI